MLFSSPDFLYAFLPLTWAVYLLLRQAGWGRAAIASLTAASIIFYGFWRPWDLPVLVGSAVFNFLLARLIDGTTLRARAWFAIAIVANLALLGWFKYTHFVTAALHDDAGLSWVHVVGQQALPLGISFFTFTQIAYLVDRRRGKAPLTSFGNYLLFVTFFPHLIAGPIIHHAEMMPQFDRPLVTWENAARGLFVLAIGLFKKVVIADQLAPIADAGFSAPASLATFDAWFVSVAYALQLYFDFSGYSDMAVGLGLLFGIRLPWNFLSPYKATDVSDFWRRWHVTLSRFLRDYVYIPLGGSRAGPARTVVNLLLTMLIGGIWHGAGWTFMLWGALHGIALAACHVLRGRVPQLPRPVAWMVTQGAVLFGWVLFRAKSVGDAMTIYAHLFGAGRHGAWTHLGSYLAEALPFALLGMGIALFAPNTAELEGRFRPTRAWVAVGAVTAMAACFIALAQLAPPEFLYYDF